MIELSEISDEVFAMVAQELSNGKRDEALWTKSFAVQNGDEAATKANYIRLRAEQITCNLQAKSGARPIAKEPQHQTNSAGVGSSGLAKKLFLIVMGLLVVLGIAKTAFTGKPAKDASTSVPTIVEKSVTTDPLSGSIHVDLLSGVTLDQPNNQIGLNGNITEAMATEFTRVLRELRARISPGDQVGFSINSKGGDVYAAMKIGREIRKDPNSYLGVWEGSECFSSCIFILAGADQRLRVGSIGIHRPYLSTPNGDESALKLWYSKLSSDAKTFFREMNVKESLFDDMVNIPPENIHIFRSTQEMDHYGLLQLDPVTAEKVAHAQMRRYSIASKSELYERKRKVEQECSGLQSNQHIDCLERVMRGG